jgi:hypothetical protein
MLSFSKIFTDATLVTGVAGVIGNTFKLFGLEIISTTSGDEILIISFLFLPIQKHHI